MSRRHQEALLDAALADSFPASDPPAMSIPGPPSPQQEDDANASTPGDAVTLLYRVVAAEGRADAFAAQPPYHAGRWTSEGMPALYASLSAGAALLEKLVHLTDGADSEALVLAIGSMPTRALVQDIPLPADWDALPHRQSVQRAGDAWLGEHRNLGIRVPSAIIRAESNVILDVGHPDFASVRLVATQILQIDDRLRR